MWLEHKFSKSQVQLLQFAPLSLLTFPFLFCSYEIKTQNVTKRQYFNSFLFIYFFAESVEVALFDPIFGNLNLDICHSPLESPW